MTFYLLPFFSFMFCWLYLQAKADEIAKLMNENEQLKSTIDGLKVGWTNSLFAYFFHCIMGQ